MSYDPDPRRRRRRKSRRSRVPPQLRAWVFGRRKRRAYDPDPARRRRRRYRRYDPDPARRRRYGIRSRARGFFAKLANKLDPLMMGLGGALGFFAPKISVIDEYWASQGQPSDYIRDFKDYFLLHMPKDFTQPRLDKTLTKICDPNYVHFHNHAPPVWGGLALAIISKLPIPYFPKRAKKLLGKFGVGMFAGGIVGALFDWKGCTPEESRQALTQTLQPTKTVAVTSTPKYG
jgi:hypothetical protein